MTTIDGAFEAARRQAFLGAEGFARWMSLVERPLRASLRRFARAVDVEVVMQETFLRMWISLNDETRVFTGDNATLRFALRVARLVALEEVRAARHDRLIPLDELDPSREPEVPPAPVKDEGLLHAIRECIDRLTGAPKRALLARLHGSHRHDDRMLASIVRMQPNTFLQNIVRARRAVAACLAEKGL